MTNDDGLLIKPEPRSRGRFVAVALVALALLALGYFGWGKFARAPRDATAALSAQAAAGDVQQAPAIILAVLPLAAGEKGVAVPPVDPAPDSADALIGALKGGTAPRDDADEELAMHFAAAMSRFAGVQVISPASSFQLRDGDEPVRAIGRKLGATHLLQGRAQRSGGQIRMDIALVRAEDGATLWFEQYQRPGQALFALQDEVVAQLAAALKVTRLASPQGTQDERPHTGNLAAYAAMLQGDARSARGDGDGLRQALAAYERAVALDPAYAHAHARLALARIALATRFPAEAGDLREQGERARRDAATALRLAPDSAEAHKANAAWLGSIALDPSGAMRATRRALALSPHDATLLHTLAIQQTAFGQLQEATGNLRRVLVLDPLSATAQYNLGGVYLGLNDYPQAEHALAQALALRPELSVVRAFRAIAVFQQNRVDEAVKLAEAEPDPLWRAYALAMVYWAKGDRTRSDAELQALIGTNAGNAATQIADIYAQRDDEAAMFQWLDTARQSGDPGIVEIRYLPFVSRYANDPRFIALAKALDLMPEAAGAGRE